MAVSAIVQIDRLDLDVAHRSKRGDLGPWAARAASLQHPLLFRRQERRIVHFLGRGLARQAIALAYDADRFLEPCLIHTALPMLRHRLGEAAASERQLQTLAFDVRI